MARVDQTGDLRVDQIMPALCPAWDMMPFEECLQDETGRFKKLKKKEIEVTGRIPVIDQGESFISGYIDNETDAYSGPLPVIIFGDHTRRIKFVDFPFAVGADGTKILKPIGVLTPKFFYYYLRCLKLESQGYSRHYRFIKQIKVPVPSIVEQRRIVAKLEKLLAKVDACKDRLEKIPAILKRFRQSVLTAACFGRLTADWRENNPDAKVSSEFVNIVLHARSSQQIELDSSDDSQNQLPTTWVLVRIDEICLDIVDCPHSTPKWANSGVICLRTTNFRPGKLDLIEVRYVAEQVYKQRTLRIEPKPSDVLYSREGGILGVACLVPDQPKVCLGQRMMIMRPDGTVCLSHFLMNMLNSSIVLNHVRDLTGGTASPHLNVGEIKKFQIPLPPIREQHEIVRRVEALFKIADDIEKRYEKAKAHVDRLTQSILAKAFRGELVPQDPNDEPASELLERIQEERRKQAAEGRPGRRGPRRGGKTLSSTL
jgi:type I restriction enzyme, S subunit